MNTSDKITSFFSVIIFTVILAIVESAVYLHEQDKQVKQDKQNKRTYATSYCLHNTEARHVTYDAYLDKYFCETSTGLILVPDNKQEN